MGNKTPEEEEDSNTFNLIAIIIIASIVGNFAGWWLSKVFL